MTTVERLQQARDLIADPEHWTRCEYARDANGIPVEPRDPRAVCWCAMGAVAAVGGGATEFDALTLAAKEQYGVRITRVNDQRGHGAVLLVFDTAIDASGAPGRQT